VEEIAALDEVIAERHHPLREARLGGAPEVEDDLEELLRTSGAAAERSGSGSTSMSIWISCAGGAPNGVSMG
jgi:hypothetical protein